MRVPTLSELAARVSTRTLPVDGLQPVQFVDATGRDRICWPAIFSYAWQRSDGSKIEQHIPPEREVPFLVVVQAGQLARFEVLMMMGMLSDPRHTGTTPSEIEDNRRAPGA